MLHGPQITAKGLVSFFTLLQYDPEATLVSGPAGKSSAY